MTAENLSPLAGSRTLRGMGSTLEDRRVNLTSATADAVNACAVTSAAPVAGEWDDRQVKNSDASSQIDRVSAAGMRGMGSGCDILYCATRVGISRESFEPMPS